MTIDDIALQQETNNNRISTSSEDMADTSDEMIEQFNSAFNTPDQSRGQGPSSDRFYEEPTQPGCSAGDSGPQWQPRMSRKEREHRVEREAHEKAQSAICEAESKKLRIAEPEGNINFINNFGREDEREIRHNSRCSRAKVDDGYESEELDDNEVGEQNLQNGQGNRHSHHPAVVDENYLVIGNYIEEHVCQRIENGEYVDFSRLLPWDWLAAEEDNRMEIVNKNRRTFFVPAVDADPGGISNFSRWEQAF